MWTQTENCYFSLTDYRSVCFATDFILLLMIILWHHIMFWYLQLLDSKLTIDRNLEETRELA